MLIELAWDGECRWFGSMRSEIFLQIKFFICQGCPTKQTTFLLGQPTPYDQPFLLVLERYFT